MFMMDYLDDAGWHDARIVPYHRFEIDPWRWFSIMGKASLKGLKAYRWPNDKICLFRPDQNWNRFNSSPTDVHAADRN